ncbi:integrase [Ancylobacter vacuolatus]|uniref:Integrase n=3 Tax=Ancylobacter vacuolatus TaxID=223389 RepID=A0ABU0DMU3_9HYPH|nr:site-specific integrase [Ancylobacter vacuolatus]MDQ0349777.1 integrase [Ancylobacter vacuolatus]
MANIYRRGEIWWGRAQKGGEEFRRSLETRSESVARDRLRTWLDELDGEKWGKRPKITVDTACNLFLREHGPTLRPGSVKRYYSSIKWLTEQMGEKLLTAIGTAELREFETWRRTRGASAPTVRRDLACLSSIYGFAIEKEWVEVNPVSAFLRARKKRGLKESPPRTRYLSKVEEARLLEGAIPRVRAAIIVAINSGLRSEEQWGLTWDRVDLARKQVVIPKEIAKGKRDRVVILLDPAVEVLKSMPRHIRSPYVFFHGGPKAIGPTEPRRISRVEKDGSRFNHMLRGLKMAAERAGVSDLIWHDLRRTHGCRLLQDHGFTIAMVRDQLGHASVVQTEKAYAFLEVETRRSAVGRTNPGTEPPAQPAQAQPVVKPQQGRRSKKGAVAGS